MPKGMLGLLPLSEIQGPRDEFEVNLASAEGEMWLREFKKYLRKEATWGVAVTSLSDTYPVTIDYSLSLANMIKASKYVWVKDIITEKMFPVKGQGVIAYELVLCHYNRRTESGEVKNLIRSVGLEPSPMEDLLAFGVKYPEEQRFYPIIALGSEAEVRYKRYLPVLHGFGSERSLCVNFYDQRWSGKCRFLARKVLVDHAQDDCA